MIYRPLYRNVLFPFYDRVIKRRSIYNHYKAMSGNPWMPLEELQRIQREKLARLVSYSARNVPYYGELFEKHNVDPEKVESIDDLRERGISLTKKKINSARDRLVSKEFDRGKLQANFTSGTTGDPIAIYNTYDNWCLKVAGKYRSEDWIGKPIGTRATMIWGHKDMRSWKVRTKYALYWRFQNYQFLSAFEISEEELVENIRKIHHHGSRFIEGYTSVLYLMAKIIEKHGLEHPKLDGIIIGAEKLFDFQKEQIERSFHCPVYDRYGSTEFMNIASECTERKGLHINIDNLWVEVVDDDDRPVIGKPGHIVITDLNNLAMPFIRYRIGDVGIMSEETCSCGRAFPMLKEIVGRVTGKFRTKDGREIHEMYFIWMLARNPGVNRFQVIQKSLTELQINIEEDGTVEREKIAAYILKRLKMLDSYAVSASVNFVDEIPLTKAGKMQFFISEISDARK